MNDTHRNASLTQDSFLTKDELARRLKKTPRTVEKWQANGFIPKIKVGTSVLYDWDEVQKHLRARFTVVAPSRRRNAAEPKPTELSAQ